MSMKNFLSYTNALELIRALRPVVERLKRFDVDAADQLTRAATSVVNNLAEGARRTGKDQMRLYVYAHGSANVIRAVLDGSDAWGWQLDAAHARAVLDHELALLWGLTHPKPKDERRGRC